MISSDSQPIQFWNIDEETANEKDVYGLIKQDCFCQPWQCDDEIKVQFPSTEPLTLQILGPEEAIENILTENFISNLGVFSSVNPGDNEWVWDSSNGGVAQTGYVLFADNSKHLQASLGISSGNYEITLDFINDSAGVTGITVEVYFGTDFISSQNVDISTSSGTLVFNLISSGSYSTLSFVAKSNPPAGVGLFSISKIVVDRTIDNVIEEVDFEEVAPDVWQLAFVPNELSSPPICDQMVSFRIIQTANFLLHPSFDTSLGTPGSHPSSNPWYNEGVGSHAWNISSGVAGVVLIPTIDNMIQEFTERTAGNYTASINSYVSAGASVANVIVKLYNGATLVQTIYNYNESATSGVDHPIAFTANLPFNKVSITALKVSGGTFSIFLNSFEIVEVTAVKKSDCIDIKTTQDCTKLISYSNSSDFDGLVYTTSPPTTFNLRIPAIFFEEDNPQEQEDLELSNGRIVTLRSTIQEKTLLDVGFMPNYMHKKLQKVLMHETIGIDGTFWKKRDSYDSSGIKKYNLKRGSVWLTKYNSVEKNTI